MSPPFFCTRPGGACDYSIREKNVKHKKDRARKQVQPIAHRIYQVPERGGVMDDCKKPENRLNVRKAFETLGQIFGDRVNVEVTLTNLRKRDAEKEDDGQRTA